MIAVTTLHINESSSHDLIICKGIGDREAEIDTRSRPTERYNSSSSHDLTICKGLGDRLAEIDTQPMEIDPAITLQSPRN